MFAMLLLIFKRFRFDTLLYVFMSLIDTVLKLSAIVFFIPLLDYMNTGGDINVSLWYWKIILNSFNFLGISLTFFTLSLFVFSIILLNEGILFFKMTYQRTFPPKVNTFLTELLVQSIFTKNYLFLMNYSPSLLISFLTQNVVTLSNLYTQVIVLMSNAFQLLMLIVALFIISIQLTLFVSLVLLLIIFITVLKLKVMKVYAKKADVNLKLTSKLVSEQIIHLKYVYVSKIRNSASAKLMNNLYDILKLRCKIFVSSSAIESIINSIYFLAAISIVCYAYEALKMPVNEIIVYLFILASRLKPLISNIPVNYTKIQESLPLISDFKKFTSDIKAIEEVVITNTLPVNKIEINNLTFSFTEKPMIKDMSLTMIQNKIYAIIGPSGMGKTTFIDLILGLFKPKSGSVNFFINQKSVKYSEINTFYMTQNPAIITGSVKENLCYIKQTHNISDDELWWALEKVQLKQTFVERDGLDTFISENATNLSMGQMQRLALARVFLSDYQLIVLDEFSNGIDNESKQLIINALKKAVKDKICLCITHDRDVIDMADEVISFNDITNIEKNTEKISEAG